MNTTKALSGGLLFTTDDDASLATRLNQLRELRKRTVRGFNNSRGFEGQSILHDPNWLI